MYFILPYFVYFITSSSKFLKCKILNDFFLFFFFNHQIKITIIDTMDEVAKSITLPKYLSFKNWKYQINDSMPTILNNLPLYPQSI